MKFSFLNYLRIFISLLYLVTIFGSDVRLDFVTEENLLQLFKDEKYVIALLGDNEDCSGRCNKLENLLLSAREELVEATESWVVRSYAPSFCSEFGVTESAILFMRSGRPLIFHEKMGGVDELLDYFQTNKDSSVHNMTDANFEHGTQAATGATTGDWLVLFTRDNCPKCQKVMPVFEAVGSRLKGQKNAAVVQREHGPVTARRFAVKTFPSILLFRLGHLYRYDYEPTDANLVISFAKETFRNSKKEKVPLPKSPFDDFTEATVDWIRENPTSFVGSVLGFVLLLALIVLLNRPPPESWVKKNKKKKS